MRTYTKIIKGVEFKVSKESGYWRCENNEEVYASKTKRGAIKFANGDASEGMFHSWK
jgi:hypothetical protein